MTTRSEDRQALGAALASVLGHAPYQDIYDELAQGYGGADRHYHTMEHVRSCLRWARRSSHLATRPSEVEVALWFHDAVQDTHRADDEARSAALAREFLSSEGATADVVDRVSRMILATADHRPETDDEALVIDIDLTILGASHDVFEAYDRQIRREYAWVSESDYRRGRAAVLRGFLERKVIYHTAEMRDELESRARANLSRRVDELEA